jgi:ABC-type bacteriocin/lantibiotic exporter with double-glycine peptidase domain
MVLRYWGLQSSIEEITSAFQVEKGHGMKAGQLRDYVRAKGLRGYLFQGNFVDLQRELERKRPVIVGVSKKYGPKLLGHYEVVVGINRQMQKIVTIDPGTGWSEDSFQGFLAEWLPAQQLTLVVSPIETQ